jgi:hypothetical protein
LDDTLAGAVLALAVRIAGAGRTPPPDAGHGTPLGAGGFRLDSVELLELIVACEDAFGVTFDPETDLTPTTLKTVKSFADVIRAKQGR